VQKLFSKILKEEIDMNWKINSFLPEVVQENFTVNNINDLEEYLKKKLF